MKRLTNYTIKTQSKENKSGTWNSLLVEIYRDNGKIGEYIRNYYAMYNTFYPFSWKGKEYALYSHDYETVSLMSLPDCKLIAEHTSGFCPVDFSVPDGDSWDDDEVEDGELIGEMALVAGCVWGDDSGGWKIEAVDLRHIDEGKIEVKPIFGYFESFYDGRLDDSVEWSSEKNFKRISFPMMARFQFEEKEEENGFLPHNFKDAKQYSGKRWDNYEFRQTFDVNKK